MSAAKRRREEEDTEVKQISESKQQELFFALEVEMLYIAARKACGASTDMANLGEKLDRIVELEEAVPPSFRERVKVRMQQFIETSRQTSGTG